MRRFVLAAMGAAIVCAPTAVVTADAAAAAATWPVVRQGATGNRVRTIQYLLNARGFRVVVDGAFGKSTTTAVKTFQRANRLAVDGHVGPATWTKLVVSIKLGSRGDAVTAAQYELRHQYAYRTVAVDGVFGKATQTAVKSFQTKRKLAPDGIIGQGTWQALMQ